MKFPKLWAKFTLGKLALVLGSKSYYKKLYEYIEQDPTIVSGPYLQHWNTWTPDTMVYVCNGEAFTTTLAQLVYHHPQIEEVYVVRGGYELC